MIFVITGICAFFVTALVLMFVLFIRPLFTAEKIYGIRFRFLPLENRLFRPKWSQKIDRYLIHDFIEAYAAVMPQAYALIDKHVTSNQIQTHAKFITVIFQRGYLASGIREKTGLNDLNNDGKRDLITGLTYSPILCEVAATDDSVASGWLDLKRTALFYELHNAFIQKFAGYEISAGEAFVPPDDNRLLPFLGGKSIKDMKQKRAVLDAAFYTIKLY